MNDRFRQRVVELGCEGGGMDVFRRRGTDRRWEYFQKESSIALDDKDDEVWNEWSKGPYDSLGALLDDAGIKQSLPAFGVFELDPDCREELLEWAASFWSDYEAEFHRRFPRAKFVTPEKWVQGRN